MDAGDVGLCGLGWVDLSSFTVQGTELKMHLVWPGLYSCKTNQLGRIAIRGPSRASSPRCVGGEEHLKKWFLFLAITPTKLEHANKPCLLEDKINLTSVFMCDQQPNRMQITQTILGIMIHWFDMYSQFKVSLVWTQKHWRLPWSIPSSIICS
jgi:hypothetical protein